MANDALPGFDQYFGKQGAGAAPAQPPPTSGALPGFDQHFAPRLPRPAGGGLQTTGATAPQPPPNATTQGGTNSAPDPSAPAGSFWSLTGPGSGGPSGQQISDWMNVAGSNQPYVQAYNRATGQQTPADLVKMRADVEAARQRLGPLGSGTADFAGTTLNPTYALNGVPYVGPGLAGAAQQGFKDYGEGKDWPTIGRDALIGGAVGEASLGLAQPKVAGWGAARLTDLGGAYAAGTLLGHGWGSEYTIPGMLGAGALLHKGADWLGGRVEDALNNPTARRAFQQLMYGGALSAKQAVDNNNWIPGQ